jgi:glycolate oxidase FAD binding subunit
MASETGADRLHFDEQAVSRVLEPASVEELQDMVRVAAGRNEQLCISGGATRLGFGNSSGPFDAVLSTRKLNRIIEYEPEDLTVAVEPGVTPAQLDAVLGEHGQQLVVDAARRTQATIGGSYATGLSGPRRLGYGALKESAIGIEVVGPDGVRAKAGGMVVKNVTGYDLMRLHYGALGAFGLVTRLNFKVVPLPSTALHCRARFRSAAGAHTAGVAVLNSGVELAALYITANAADAWELHALVHGNLVAAERQTQRIAQVASGHSGTADVVIVDADSVPAFDGFLDLAADRIIARLSAPASQQATVLARMAFSGSEQLCADLGSGLIYISTLPEIEWRVAIQRLDPRAVFLSLPTEYKRSIDVMGGERPVNLDVLRRLKHEFDSAGRFNHGRFVGFL